MDLCVPLLALQVIAAVHVSLLAQLNFIRLIIVSLQHAAEEYEPRFPTR